MTELRAAYLIDPDAKTVTNVLIDLTNYEGIVAATRILKCELIERVRLQTPPEHIILVDENGIANGKFPFKIKGYPSQPIHGKALFCSVSTSFHEEDGPTEEWSTPTITIDELIDQLQWAFRAGDLHHETSAIN